MKSKDGCCRKEREKGQGRGEVKEERLNGGGAGGWD